MAPGMLLRLPAESFKKEYGDWLAGFAWDVVVTLTSESRMSSWTMMKIFRDRFIRRATRLAQRAVPHFMTIERGALGDRPHVHAVLGGLEGIPCARIAKLWDHGRADVRIYDPALGACWYITKETGDCELEFDLSRSPFPLVRGR